MQISRMKIRAKLVILCFGAMGGVLGGRVMTSLEMTALGIILIGFLVGTILMALLVKYILLKRFTAWSLDLERYKKYGLYYCVKCGDYYPSSHHH